MFDDMEILQQICLPPLPISSCFCIKNLFYVCVCIIGLEINCHYFVYTWPVTDARLHDIMLSYGIKETCGVMEKLAVSPDQ